MLLSACASPADKGGKNAANNAVTSRNPDSRDVVLVNPVPIKRVSPIHPRFMQAERVGGEVILELYINETGVVEDLVVLRASDKRFIPYAVAAAKKWVFKPGTANGKPVAFKITLPMVFTRPERDSFVP